MDKSYGLLHIWFRFTLQQNVYDAIQEWTTKTSLNFIQGTGSGDYIEFIIGNRNYSNSIGRKGGKQQICLSATGSDRGTVLHELGHSVGLIHEQCRVDRDNYVIILWNNIMPEYVSQFELYPTGAVRDIGSFDFNSIMLYSSLAFAIDNNNATMTTIDGYYFWRQRSYLSTSDVEGIKSIYGPPFHHQSSTINVINEYVSGIDDYYEYDETYTINIYNNINNTQPATLIYPRDVTYIEEKHTCTGYGRPIQVTRTYKHVLLPAGTSSYDLGTVRNIEHYVCSNPNYVNRTIYYVLE